MTDHKKNFTCNQRVRIIKTSSDVLDNKCGIIKGVAFSESHDHYIVLLDNPVEIHDGRIMEAIQITEFCIEQE